MQENSPAIELRDIVRCYDGHSLAVDQVSLAISPGTLLALLGPSGCGKTTLLRLIAGLERPDAGQVWLNGRQVAGEQGWLPPEARRVGLVFQEGALFPHLTITENIAFGLHGWSAAERHRRVDEMLEVVNLPGLKARYPHQLSGGQQQRVALARALAPRPPILLLDEPFANLDAALRRELRAEVAGIVRSSSTTAVFVTHDQEEALSTADLVAVMDAGKVLQLGTAPEVYERPATRGIALFVGEANLLPGLADGLQAHCALGLVELLKPANGPLELLIRPERLLVERVGAANAQIISSTYYGHDQLLDLGLDDATLLRARCRPQPDLLPGRRVRVGVSGKVWGW